MKKSPFLGSTFLSCLTLAAGFLTTHIDAGLGAESVPPDAIQGVFQLDPDAVVAKVGDEPIVAGEVNRMVVAVMKGQKLQPETFPILQAQLLSELLDRRLVLAFANRTQSGVAPGEIDAAIARLTARLAQQGRTLQGYLRDQSMTADDLRRQATWKLTWGDYLKKYITPARCSTYYEAHRRELDGTEIAVSHILLRPEKGSPGWVDEALVKRAGQLREEIVAGKIAFEEAAKKHSSGPSSKDGGRLGFIPRRGVMDEAFSRATFALEVGQISPPVESPFGVHLIRCDQIRPGKKTLEEAQPQVEEALGKELMEKIVRIEKQYTKVEFTGRAPYIRRETGELVLPTIRR